MKRTHITLICLILLFFTSMTSESDASNLEHQIANRIKVSAQNINALNKIDRQSLKGKEDLFDAFSFVELGYLSSKHIKNLTQEALFLIILSSTDGSGKAISFTAKEVEKENFLYTVRNAHEDFKVRSSSLFFGITISSLNCTIIFNYNNPFQYSIIYKGITYSIDEILNK